MNKNAKLKSVFLKTIVFKVMKAISYPQKSEYRLFYSSINKQRELPLSNSFVNLERQTKKES